MTKNPPPSIPNFLQTIPKLSQSCLRVREYWNYYALILESAEGGDG